MGEPKVGVGGHIIVDFSFETAQDLAEQFSLSNKNAVKMLRILKRLAKKCKRLKFAEYTNAVYW